MKIQIALAGAVIGFMASGPLGAVIGFLVGLYIEFVSKDNSTAQGDQVENRFENRPKPNDFNYSLLILIASIMNADGVAMKSELELVKRMLIRTYGEEKTRSMLLELRELIKERHDVASVCRQIRIRMAYSQRLELLHILFRVSKADNDINNEEMQMLNYISVHLGITTADFMTLRAMFVRSPDSAYKILDVTQSASEEDVKKAYRKMAMRFHPDRLVGLSEDEKKAAHEKFLKVQMAYDTIKKQKGWS